MIADKVCWIKTDDTLTKTEGNKRVNDAIEKLFAMWKEEYE